MRRKSKRAFRYFFPVALLLVCIILFKNGPSKDYAKNTNQKSSESEIEAHVDTSAKILKMISHNPETKSKMQINAQTAVQMEENIVLLHNPCGLFENAKGQSSLTSSEAKYLENCREVHFFENVNFSHPSGLTATTSHATVNTKTQDIIGDQGVKACHNESTITANSYEIQKSGNLINFKGNVSLNVDQKNTKR